MTTNGKEVFEVAEAEARAGHLDAAYEAYLLSASKYAREYDPRANTYVTEPVDEDMAIYLRGEDRMDRRGFEALHEAASCAALLGDRARMQTAYDRAALVRLRPADRKTYLALRADRKNLSLRAIAYSVRRELTYYVTELPEGREALAHLIEQHVAAGRFEHVVRIHREVIDGKMTIWGNESPALHLAKLDMAEFLLRIGRVGEARVCFEECKAGILAFLAEERRAALADGHPFLALAERGLAATATAAEIPPQVTGDGARAIHEYLTDDADERAYAMWKLLQENCAEDALEAVVSDAWERFERQTTFDEAERQPAEAAFREAAYDAAPAELRAGADPADFGRASEPKRCSRRKAQLLIEELVRDEHIALAPEAAPKDLAPYLATSLRYRPTARAIDSALEFFMSTPEFEEVFIEEAELRGMLEKLV